MTPAYVQGHNPLGRCRGGVEWGGEDMDQPNSRRWLKRNETRKKRQPLGRCACAMCKGVRREGALERGAYGADARGEEAVRDALWDLTGSVHRA